MVAGQAFEHVLFKMTDAFETRAKQLSERPL
jgi:ribosome-associated toxin RatA of RatAB toxin-antitoxin module